ncbi:MAG TPA: hypothetical protein PKD91_00135, partial [Bacteroidia bacterium]|nr:hypothetical protein [Bacteroidia bacterium]
MWICFNLFGNYTAQRFREAQTDSKSFIGTIRMRKSYLCFTLACVFFIVLGDPASCQPYFDAAGFSGWYLPAGKADERPAETHMMLFVSIPFDLNKNDKIVISPWHENRYLKDEYPNESLF